MSYAIIIKINNERTKSDLSKLQEDLKDAGIDGTYDEDFHITLVQFEQGVQATELRPAIDILKQLDMPAMKLKFAKIAKFPSAIYAPIVDSSNQLETFYRSILELLEKSGLKGKYKIYSPFLPHCSIGTGCDPVSDDFLKSLRTPREFLLDNITLLQKECIKGEQIETVVFEKSVATAKSREMFGSFAKGSDEGTPLVASATKTSTSMSCSPCNIL